MKLVLCFFNFAFLLFCLASCYTPRYVYSPSAHNVPVLTKKGDSKLAVNYSVNPVDNTVKDSIPVKAKARGYDLQAAYAITNHWAIQLNYFHRTERNAGDFDAGNRDSVVINYKRNLTEIGLGYFHALNENKRSFVQIFAGAGFGKFSFTDNGRDRNGIYRSHYHNVNVTRVFVQPALTVRSRRNFAASFSIRSSDPLIATIVQDYLAEITDVVITQISSRSSEELLTVGGKNLLKDELISEINNVINFVTKSNSNVVSNILFTTFVIK